MDWLTFIAALAGDIAALAGHIVSWPLAFVIAVLLLREPLGDLIRSLRRFRYRELEMHFSEKMERIERIGKEVAREVEKLPPPRAAEEPTKGLETVADVDPRVAVTAAWTLIEPELRAVGERVGLTESRMSAGQLIKALEDMGEFNTSFAMLLEDLWHFRNDVAHVDTLPTEQARRYVDVATNVARRLRTVGK